jgi:hypothetical protein
MAVLRREVRIDKSDPVPVSSGAGVVGTSAEVEAVGGERADAGVAMLRVGTVLGCLLLATSCTAEMPADGDPSDRGELSFTILFDDGEPATGYDYYFEPAVSNSGGVQGLRNTLTFPSFPAQEYEFTFTHSDASEPVSTTVTVTPDAPTNEEVRLPRR